MFCSVLLEKQKDPTSTLLSDFDMAMMQDASAEEKYGLVGTKGYTAPELGSMDYDNKVDVWSLGVVLFIMLLARHPWPMHCAAAAGIQMLKLHSEDISKDAADLITGMLVEDPRQRLSTKQILEHPWLVSTQSAQGGGKSNGRSHLERAPVV